ncbi:MAG: geranylgeranyl pyrophosphate synthase [Bacilli bacterium]|nr:geranylgeranyl pyrophosphate synthase [Bacilli bacterium]
MIENDKIMEQARKIISNHCLVTEICDQMTKFFEFKKKFGFPFGNLAILHYQMFGGNNKDIYKAAAAIEMMILSTDIFDDLHDQDNKSVPWNQLNQAVSMNIASGLLILSTMLLEESSFPLENKILALNTFNSQLIKAVNGQHLDITNSANSENDCLQMIKLKSASLLVCACVSGTVLVNKDHGEMVGSYAEDIGIVAQIKNDITDTCNWEGKNDLIRRKRTLPLLFLINSREPETQIIRDYYADKLNENAIFNNRNEITDIIQKSGAYEYASVILRVHHLEALEKIGHLPVSTAWKERLLGFI